MADNPQPEQRQPQLRIDPSRMTTTYANTVVTSYTPEEVFLDFGIHQPAQGPGGEPVINIAIGSRCVMTWVGAKRAAISLYNLIRQYEQANGEINVGPKAPAGGANAGGGAGGGPRLVQ
ncbi:MAG: DUF3467 domain-containing protein [Tepidisphaera sp.]|jgi:hypothetical protein